MTPAQAKVLTSEAEIIVVPSGPGSGKTFIAEKRAGARVLEGAKVIVLTFTNEAAFEFRRRLNIQPEFVGTLHSYCLRLIRQFGHLKGYRPGSVAIVDEAERWRLLSSIRERMGLRKKVTEQDIKLRSEPAKLIWQEYEFVLKSNNMVDYDQMLTIAAVLLREEEVSTWAKCDELIVEEAQDSAAADWLVYTRIPAARKMFIGDPDQSIFGFRGAYAGGMMAMSEMFGAETIVLEENFRSDHRICECATRLIRHNSNRFSKDVIPTSPYQGVVRVEQFANVWEETESLLQKFVAARAYQQTFAALVRTNFEADRIANFFRAMGLECSGNVRHRPAPDWNRALILIGLIASPESELLAERLLVLDCGAEETARIKTKQLASGVPLTEYLNWKPTDNLGALPEVLALNRIDPDTIKLIQERASLLPPDATASDLLQDLMKKDEAVKLDEPSRPFIGTIHSAKGHEWDAVALPAFEYSSVTEDERRLAFVAVTRARHELYISVVSVRQGQWGPPEPREPSPFIAEMGLT